MVLYCDCRATWRTDMEEQRLSTVICWLPRSNSMNGLVNQCSERCLNLKKKYFKFKIPNVTRRDEVAVTEITINNAGSCPSSNNNLHLTLLHQTLSQTAESLKRVKLNHSKMTSLLCELELNSNQAVKAFFGGIMDCFLVIGFICELSMLNIKKLPLV